MPGRIVIFESYEAMGGIVSLWEDLAIRSEPNVFYEPALLIPAMKYLRQPGEEPFVVAIFDPHSYNRLLGLFPMVRYRAFRRMPFAHFGNWKHKHAFYCAPLVDRGSEGYCVEALFKGLRKKYPGVRTYRFELLDTDSTLYACLRDVARFSVYFRTGERAMLDTSQARGRSLFNSKDRSDLRRREKRFGELGLGTVTYHYDEGNDEASRWADEFLALEASGWKGQSGTAMGSSAGERSFFLEATRNLAASGRLRTTSMRLNGQVIAANCDFLAGDTCFGFKSAYDERHGSLSPGKLLHYRHAERLLDDLQVLRHDTCTASDNVMLNRMYPMRRNLATLLLSRKPSVASAAIRYIIPNFVVSKARLRRRTRQLRAMVDGASAKIRKRRAERPT